MTNFWLDKMAETTPAPEAELPAQSYAAYQAAKPANGSSGSYIYSAEYQAAISGQRAAARPSIYEPGPGYQGLGSYPANKADALARKAGESAEAWERRIKTVIRHLPDEQQAALLAAIEQAKSETPKQGYLTDNRSLVDVAQERAAIHGRFGGRTLEAQGALALAVEPLSEAPHLISSVEAAMIARQRQAEARGQLPQRTAAPTGSSGEGIFVR